MRACPFRLGRNLNRSVCATGALTRRTSTQPRLRLATEGLRREEVAELAGIDVDWYVRLEQGQTRLACPERSRLRGLARDLVSRTAQLRRLSAKRPSLNDLKECAVLRSRLRSGDNFLREAGDRMQTITPMASLPALRWFDHDRRWEQESEWQEAPLRRRRRTISTWVRRIPCDRGLPQ